MKPTNIFYRWFNGRPYIYRLVEPEEENNVNKIPDEVYVKAQVNAAGLHQADTQQHGKYKHRYVLAEEPLLVTYEQMWDDFKKFHGHNRSPGSVVVNANTFHYIREHFTALQVCVIQAITEISFGITTLDVVINDELADGEYMFASYERYGG